LIFGVEVEVFKSVLIGQIRGISQVRIDDDDRCYYHWIWVLVFGVYHFVSYPTSVLTVSLSCSTL